MKLFRTLLAVALLAASTTAMAQTRKVVDRVDQRVEKVLDRQDVSYQFKSHAFLDLQGGAQYTLGEAKFKDRIAPNFQIGLGYQFTPVFGARIAANGLTSKGGWKSYVLDGNRRENVTYDFKYIAPGIDFMFNLSNLFCGWNPDRVFNVTAFLGAGANIVTDNEDAENLSKAGYNMQHIYSANSTSIVGRGGLEFNFRLSDAVSLMLEGNANIINDHYNSKHADNPDWYFNALAGLRINLGKSRKAIVTDVYRDVVHNDTVWKFIEEPKKIEPIRRDIFFTINSIVVADIEQAKIKDIADYMNKYPKAKVTVSGYADKGTGNAQINARLAAGRADVVVRDLIEKYGISADRITYDSYGDTVQPFAENDLNRVSICIANPE